MRRCARCVWGALCQGAGAGLPHTGICPTQSPFCGASTAACRHFPALSSIHARLWDAPAAALFTAAAGACALVGGSALGRLTTLGLMFKESSQDNSPCGPLLLTPLSCLGALTALTVLCNVDDASRGWLPPSLRRLLLANNEANPAATHWTPAASATLGSGWLREITGCRRLESLVCKRLMPRDVQLVGGPVPPTDTLLHVLTQVRARGWLRGDRLRWRSGAASCVRLAFAPCAYT